MKSTRKSTQYIVSKLKRPYKVMVSIITIWSFLFTPLEISSVCEGCAKSLTGFTNFAWEGNLRPLALSERELAKRGGLVPQAGDFGEKFNPERLIKAMVEAMYIVEMVMPPEQKERAIISILSNILNPEQPMPELTTEVVRRYYIAREEYLKVKDEEGLRKQSQFYKGRRLLIDALTKGKDKNPHYSRYLSNYFSLPFSAMNALAQKGEALREWACRIDQAEFMEHSILGIAITLGMVLAPRVGEKIITGYDKSGSPLKERLVSKDEYIGLTTESGCRMTWWEYLLLNHPHVVEHSGMIDAYGVSLPIHTEIKVEGVEEYYKVSIYGIDDEEGVKIFDILANLLLRENGQMKEGVAFDLIPGGSTIYVISQDKIIRYYYTMNQATKEWSLEKYVNGKKEARRITKEQVFYTFSNLKDKIGELRPEKIIEFFDKKLSDEVNPGDVIRFGGKDGVKMKLLKLADGRLVLIDQETQRDYNLRDGVTTVGRGNGNDINVNNPGVSRHHAQIVLTPEGTVRVYDLGSRNGTVIEPGPPSTLRPVSKRAKSLIESSI